MTDSARRLENGPVESRGVRRLLYLGDGLHFGVILSVVAALNLSPLLVSPEARRGSIPLQEWYEIRHFRWIALLGSLIGGLLVVSSVLVWGWNWPVRSAVPVITGGALLGVLVRVAGVYLIERRNPELQQEY